MHYAIASSLAPRTHDKFGAEYRVNSHEIFLPLGVDRYSSPSRKLHSSFLHGVSDTFCPSTTMNPEWIRRSLDTIGHVLLHDLNAKTRNSISMDHFP